VEFYKSTSTQSAFEYMRVHSKIKKNNKYHFHFIWYPYGWL